MRKLQTLAFAIPLTTFAALAWAGVAHANPSQASATCQGGISYEGHDYPSSGNTVKIYWDGTVVKTVTFGTATSGTVANPDKTVAHTWSVVWDRFNGIDGDRTQSGTVAACAVVVTTTSVAATTTTNVAPTTTTVAPTTTLVATDDELTPVDTTTTAAPPPVVVVAVGDPVVPVPQGVLATSGQTLPATGLRGDLMWVAALTVLAGFVLVLITRRRTA